MPLKEAEEKTQTDEKHRDDGKVKYVTVHYSRTARSDFILDSRTESCTLLVTSHDFSFFFFYSRDQVQVTNLPKDGAEKESSNRDGVVYSVLAKQP